MIQKLYRFFNTIKYLRPIQIYGRVLFKLKQPWIVKNPLAPELENTEIAASFIEKMQSFFPPQTFCFLNMKEKIGTEINWNASHIDKLWLYNLHYFDDLTANNADKRVKDHQRLIDEWIKKNPLGKGNGWEPYTLSLRIVNWIKWLLISDRKNCESMIASLFLQTQFLSKKVEYHLLGNHLIANAKALIFSGLYFKGKKAQKWLKKGLHILERQLPEQILSDGGHIERSPMYHAIILEDMLDLVQLDKSYPGKIESQIVSKWRTIIQRMLTALKVMTHPDGDIAFFNDSALKIAPSFRKLKEYASFHSIDILNNNEMALPETGYYTLRKGIIHLILDAAPLGPDYLPAHGHADSLSFELSHGKKRLIVNSGTSCYGSSDERLRQRKTAAHNTLTIDGEDSSEVWSGFRVARRANVKIEDVILGKEKDLLTAEHDGFNRFRNIEVHKRTWALTELKLLIQDQLSGKGFHDVAIYYHFYPGMKLKKKDHVVNVYCSDNRLICQIKVEKEFTISIRSGTYHPEFGLERKNQRMILKQRLQFPNTVKTVFNFMYGGD